MVLINSEDVDEFKLLGISSIDVCRFPNGNGILSGSISHFGRGLEEEMREKKGFFEELVEKKKEQP